MSRRKLVAIQLSTFKEFVDMVKNLLNKTRSWYVKETSACRPFIVVAHDVWDSKRLKLNGITIMFTYPETLEVYRIPIALTPPIGETAMELSQTNMMGLDRFGISFNDLYTAVTDNCTATVKAGQLTIAGGERGETMTNRAEDIENPQCDMHLGALAA
eukprot:6237958-Ditylum_brightwellii.AAC.1